MELVRKVVSAKDLLPGETGVTAAGSKVRKVGPMLRLERTDVKGWKYSMPDEDETPVRVLRKAA